MGSYKKLYLEDANELMRLLFEETAKDKTIDFAYFVKEFSKCKYRRLLDKGSTRLINMTYDELIYYLERDCKQIYKKGKFSIDYMQAGWIGRMYNTLQFEAKIPFEEIYKKVPLEKMMEYFIPLHTVSEEIAFEKIFNKNFRKKNAKIN